MKMPYQAISCDYVDYIEHLATLKEKVVICFKQGDEIMTTEEQQIDTWINEGNGEYLYTISGLKIRLDHIVTINGKSPKVKC